MSRSSCMHCSPPLWSYSPFPFSVWSKINRWAHLLLNKYNGESGKALKKLHCLPLKLWIKEADPTKCWLRFTADMNNVQTL